MPSHSQVDAMVNILDQEAFGSNYENGGGMDVLWHPEINVKGAHFII